MNFKQIYIFASKAQLLDSNFIENKLKITVL